MSQFHIAQINIANMRAPIDSDLMASFVAQLDRINALADRAPGFVWRLQSESNNATDIQAYEDPLILINMSVWASLEALRAYTYKSDHVAIMRQRQEWFTRATAPTLALWWVPAGHLPTVAEGKGRLDQLRRQGPSPAAFTFKRTYHPVTENRS